jgi:hypothetical protein
VAGLRIDILTVVALTVLSCSSCARDAAAPAQQQSQPAWGTQVQGLQCRLRPLGTAWHAGEPPCFAVDLRNGGQRTFAFIGGTQAPVYQVSVDRRWYRLVNPPVQGKVQALAPGVEIADAPLSLSDSMHLPLKPGRHTIQVSFLFEGLEVVSNPVRIKVLSRP